MENKKKEIEAKLETLKKGLSNPQLKTNPQLKKSLEKKIFDLEDELVKLKPEAKVKEIPKTTIVKTATKTTEKKAKLQKLGGFSLGDKVSFIERGTDKEKKGEIIKFNIHKGNNFSLVKTKEGEQWVSLKKLGK